MNIHIVGANGKMGKMLQELTPHHAIDEADVILDFSSPEGTREALALALAFQKPLVIGTTGLDPDIHEAMKEAARSIPLLYSANFSLAVALLTQTIKQLRTLCPEASLSLIETHHIHKKDAPSGTAKAIQRAIGEEVPITSIREGEVVGRHAVCFKWKQEQLVLEHEAFSRKAFAEGALFAARFLLQSPPGFYTLEEALKSGCPI